MYQEIVKPSGSELVSETSKSLYHYVLWKRWFIHVISVAGQGTIILDDLKLANAVPVHKTDKPCMYTNIFILHLPNSFEKVTVNSPI